MFIPVFALNKGSSLYQEADFETHFSGTSLDRPLYLKTPPDPNGGVGHSSTSVYTTRETEQIVHPFQNGHKLVAIRCSKVPVPGASFHFNLWEGGPGGRAPWWGSGGEAPAFLTF